jgi:hypothetical protein
MMPQKEIVADDSATESVEKVSSPTSLSHAGQEAGGESEAEAAANSNRQSDDHEMMNNDDGGRDDGVNEESEAEVTTMTETWTTMDNDEDDSLGEVTEGLETRADDDDEIQDVVMHVQDKVSQIMGVNLTNVSTRCMRAGQPFYAH